MQLAAMLNVMRVGSSGSAGWHNVFTTGMPSRAINVLSGKSWCNDKLLSASLSFLAKELDEHEHPTD